MAKPTDLEKLMEACRTLLNCRLVDYPAPTKEKRMAFRKAWDELEAVYDEIDDRTK